MAENDAILSLRHITKIYPGVVALDDVSIDFREGEIHALVGENGAGKSTLIKVITGAIAPERGEITVAGETYEQMLPAIARSRGIEAIYQELNLVDSLSAAENICLGKKYGKIVDFKRMNEVAQELFDRFNINIDPATPVENLTTAQRQIVEIAKSVSKNARILILDEPTASLTMAEVEVLTNIIGQLKAAGTTIIYISHRLDEIFQLCDRVTVLRDGRFVKTLDVAETDRKELISLMVGRVLSEIYHTNEAVDSDVVFEMRNLTGNGVKNISLRLHAGEILGVGGLVGAGRSEIMKVAFGAEKKQWGRLFVRGEEVDIRSPIDAMRHGIGFVPEDRKREGCFLEMSIRWNTVISTLKAISKGVFVDKSQETEVADRYQKKLRIATPSLDQTVMNLSGGNQQKVVISKVLAANTDIIILDEPTRGVDVGAKQEIYELMNALCAEGKSIIMSSSDMEELLGMSDRIVVLAEGEYAGEVDRAHFSQEYILHLASGGSVDEMEQFFPAAASRAAKERQ